MDWFLLKGFIYDYNDDCIIDYTDFFFLYVFTLSVYDYSVYKFSVFGDANKYFEGFIYGKGSFKFFEGDSKKYFDLWFYGKWFW